MGIGASGNAGNCVRSTKTLGQDNPIYEYLWESKVFRNCIGVQVMQADNGAAAKCIRLHWHGKCQMNNVGSEFAGYFGKLIVVPEVASHRISAEAADVKRYACILVKESVF
jgi:hypothetical protein